MNEVMDRLRRLAEGNDTRHLVLQERTDRQKARWRNVVCPACHEREFTKRAPQDICDPCLTDLWNARDVMAGAYEKATTDGLQPVTCTTTPHRMEYPGLATRSERIPADATFARTAYSGTENSDRTLQILYVELMTALSTILSSDPQSRQDAAPVIPFQGSQSDTLHARLPAGAVKALRDLWDFVRWHSHEAFRQGYDNGHNLLSRLNLGQETAETFSAQIQQQTKQVRERMEQIERGKRPPLS